MGQSDVLTHEMGLKEIAHTVTQALASYKITGREARFTTPFIAPGGSVISIVIHPDDESGWMVHDDGFGACEAEATSSLNIYKQVARSIADKEGLNFDQRMIFCTSVSEDWLPNAVIILGSAVKLALMRTAEKQAAAIHDQSKLILIDRLEHHFGAKFISKNAEISGAAGTLWKVDALVNVPAQKWRGAFEIVSPHVNSIASSFTKLSDIGATENPPKLIAVKQSAAKFEAPHLSLLSRAASLVVDLDRPVIDWIKFAA